ncbi:hypothetical protein CDL15_Pgr007579 [Punica granatum]|nr:hypothetical protein CDL15_Pgr007579 [Punica granatum]
MNGPRCPLLRYFSCFCYCSHNNRPKALQIAAGFSGVEKVGLMESDSDKIEVAGVGIDAAKLIRMLRKKVGFATLDSVTIDQKKKDDDKKPLPECLPPVWSSYPCGYPQIVIA